MVSMENKIKISCGLLLLVLGMGAKTSIADDFTAEASYLHYSTSSNDPDDSTGDIIFASWYLDPVKTGGVPLAEAAFFNRVSSANIFAYRTARDSAPNGYENRGYSVGLSYGSPEHPWIIGGGYGAYNIDFESGGEIQSKNWSVNAGYYLSEGLALMAFYSRNDDSYPESNLKAHDINYGIGGKWVNLLTAGTAVSIAADLSFDRFESSSGSSSNGQGFSILGSYYFTPSISAGLSYRQQTDDDSDFDFSNYGVNAKVFINPGFFVEADVSRTSLDGVSQSDIDTWFAGLGIRF